MTRCSRSLECGCKRSFQRNVIFVFCLKTLSAAALFFVVFPSADTYWQFHLKTGVDDTETLLMMMEEDVAAPCCCGAWGTYVRIYEDMTGGILHLHLYIGGRIEVRGGVCEREEEEEETVDRIHQNSPDHLRLLCLPVRPCHVR